MWEKKHTASDSITNNRIGLQGVWGWKVGYGRDPPGPELEVAGINPPPGDGKSCELEKQAGCGGLGHHASGGRQETGGDDLVNAEWVPYYVDQPISGVIFYVFPVEKVGAEAITLWWLLLDPSCPVTAQSEATGKVHQKQH